MKILIVTQYFWPENFRINDLAVGLKEKGHDVTVFTGLPNYPSGSFFKGYGFFKKKYREKYKGVDVYRVPLFPRGSGKGWELVLNYLSYAFIASILGPLYFRKRFDAIFVFEVSPITVGIPAIVLKKIFKAPILFWVLDLWPESISSAGTIKSGNIINLVRILVRFIYKQCDKILVSSKGFIPSIFQIDSREDLISYFPNFIENVNSIESDAPEDKYAQPLPSGFRIMYAGNIGYAQSFPTILAAAEILKKYKDIHWIIIGDGRMGEWVNKQVYELGLTETVHLMGAYPQEAMPYYFDKSDVMLVSLRSEPNFALTVPGKIQSYLACGKPVIASIDGEGAELILEAGAGIACPAEDVYALVESILAMYHCDPSVLKDMGERGKRFCELNFDRDVLIERLEQLLIEVSQTR
ncbi:glycosyltransferase family 4 protein [Desulfoluna spongiiphila]|uniref:Glycosyltransferase involved in cell wall bisynthesis n=1 Tax=Desulfoluna spongiiphila TaxID=419481 RepID=A0A1G5JUI6_9BACT|nr:glycosyltransferase family 4 protein [Desulfoluna spongiiphila]SCY91428.1 Glycosyltransferase involved in cell wall bisynthesis [Desulfoluna spongiiphila]